MPRLLGFATVSWIVAACPESAAPARLCNSIVDSGRADRPPPAHPVWRPESATPATRCDSVVDSGRAETTLLRTPYGVQKVPRLLGFATVAWIAAALGGHPLGTPYNCLLYTSDAADDTPC
eukprot:2361660-Pyramimonas_sp.AAC.1